ncbi:MAG: DUF2723 domain-containing protein, partial [Chloroflexi bacterium]|nr:DUF2723 domain-containing protein [Chloroflexota bacterium]
RILRRWGVSGVAAIGALGLLACSTFFWALSLIAEVYTLQTALTAGLILALGRWAERPIPRRLVWVGLLLGLGLAHHGATLLLIPGCAWCIISTVRRQALSPRQMALDAMPAMGALLLGLSVYLYLPLRYAAQPAFNYAGHYDATGTFRPLHLDSPGDLWGLVSAQTFAASMFDYRGAELWGEVAQFGVRLWRAFFAAGVGPGLLGAVVLLRRERPAGVMLLLMFVVSAVFFVDYRVPDKDTMFLSVYLIWALWLGAGYQWLVNWLGESRSAGVMRWEIWLLRGAMAGVVLVAAIWNWPLVNRAGDWSVRERGVTLLREAEPGALVLGRWDTVPLIEYLQLVEGLRPDVQAINRFLIAQGDMYDLVTREVARRPVYIDTLPDDLPATLDATPVGLLYRLRPAQPGTEVK